MQAPPALVATELGLIKFPRTSHLFDFGSTSVVCYLEFTFWRCWSRRPCALRHGIERLVPLKGTAAPSNRTLPRHCAQISIEEKVDGSNLGISVDAESRLCFQNRSHYVNSTTQQQVNFFSATLSSSFFCSGASWRCGRTSTKLRSGR
jgi:hypothetical protein